MGLDGKHVGLPNVNSCGGGRQCAAGEGARGVSRRLKHTRYSAALYSSEPAPNRGSSRSDCLHRDGYGRANFNLLRARIIIGA